jgi:signal peptidase
MIGKIFKITINTILIILILIGILVIFSFVPFPGNYKIFTVQSGSMEPAIKTGSLIFVKPEANYNVGDVITRRTTDPKVTITHRIFSKTDVNGQTAFETKGDANNAPDAEKFTEKGIIGKVLLAIPFLGFPVSFAKTTQGLILIVIIPAVIIIYDELNKIKAEIRRKMEEKKKKKKEEDEN